MLRSFRKANVQGADKLTTPIFQEQNEVFAAEGFQRAIGKPFGGAKPHISKCLNICFFAMFGLSLTVPWHDEAVTEGV